MLISSVIGIVYLIFCRPLKKARTHIQILLMEVIILISNIYLLVLVIWDHQENDHLISHPSLAIIILNFVYVIISLLAAVIEVGIVINGLCKSKVAPEPKSQSVDLHFYTTVFAPEDKELDFSNRSFAGEESDVQLGAATQANGRINLTESITDIRLRENYEVVQRNKRRILFRDNIRDHFRRNSLAKDIEQEEESVIKRQSTNNSSIQDKNMESQGYLSSQKNLEYMQTNNDRLQSTARPYLKRRMVVRDID